jgi:ABC-2 type transport system permease protein
MINPTRMLAVTERDLRRLMRNAKLLIPMALMPVIYLVILGNSMGGDLKNIPVAVVCQDNGEASARVLERLNILAQSRGLMKISREADPAAATAKLREGIYRAAVIISPGFSEDVARGETGQIGLIMDNTDATAANTVEAEIRQSITNLRVGGVEVVPATMKVERVDSYGHKEFMQYLVPGVIALALFFVAMLAGGIILVDDRARGIHEGYFVTPLSSMDLVGGLTLSATTMAMIIANMVLLSALVIAKLPLIGGVTTFIMTEGTMLLLALDLILFMFFLMARVSNPMTPRSLFGILNVLTFFPSGALYPTESYPVWLTALSVAFPMRYAVHALRGLLLKGVDFSAVAGDFVFMGSFAAIMMILASVSFKRTL